MSLENVGFARVKTTLYPHCIEYEVWQGDHFSFPIDCVNILKNTVTEPDTIDPHLFGLEPRVRRAIRLAYLGSTLKIDQWYYQLFMLSNADLFDALFQLTDACCQSQIKGNPYCLEPVKQALKTIKEVTCFEGDYLDAVSGQREKWGVKRSEQ